MGNSAVRYAVSPGTAFDPSDGIRIGTSVTEYPQHVVVHGFYAQFPFARKLVNRLMRKPTPESKTGSIGNGAACFYRYFTRKAYYKLNYP